MWHCVISGGVIACQWAINCFKYYNLWYAVRFAWCHWGKISKFNIFHFLPASAISVSDNFLSPYGDSRWRRGKWLEVTVTDAYKFRYKFQKCIQLVIFFYYVFNINHTPLFKLANVNQNEALSIHSSTYCVVLHRGTQISTRLCH